MPAQIFRAPLPIPIQGYRPDLPPRSVPPTALYQANNWLVRDGAMQARPGFSNKFADNAVGAARPMGFVQYVHTDGIARVVNGTAAGWRKFNSGTSVWNDITGTPLTGTATSQQAFRVFHRAGTSHLIGCNGKDTPKKWDGTAGTYSDIAGTPPISKAMMTLFSRVILLNLVTAGAGATASPVGYDCSNINDFDTGWGSAQFGLLNDTPGAIVSGLEFGNLQGAVYKTDAIVMAIAQAALAPFRFEWRQTGIAGPGSALSVVPINDNLHAYLGNDGAVYSFDGVRTRSVGYHIQKHVLNTADMFALDRSYGLWDFERQELWIFYPENGSTDTNLGMVINMATGTMEPVVQTGALWPLRFDPAAIVPAMGAKLKIASSITWSNVVGPFSAQTKTYSQYDSQLRRTVIGDAGGQCYTDIASGDGAGAAAVGATSSRGSTISALNCRLPSAGRR